MIAITMTLSSCAEGPPEDPSILAIFDGGQVTVSDLDRAVLALPPIERQAQLASPERLQNIVRRLAFNTIMERELDELDLDEDESFRVVGDAIRRRATIALYLRTRDFPAPVDPPDLGRWLEEHPELRSEPPRREVYTLFRHFPPGVPREQTIESVREARRRIENGEAFSRVAEQMSESETRHRGGLLGSISPGQLAPALDRIINSLDEGELSEPIVTKDGVHLFWVKSVVEGRELAEAELRPLAMEEFAREKREEVFSRAMLELEVEEPHVPSPEDLQTILRSEDPRVVVLEVGDRSFDRVEIQSLLNREETARSGDVSAFLREVARTEALRQEIKRQGLVSTEEIEQTSESAIMQECLRLHANLRIRAWLDSNEDRLKQAFESESSRYRTPLSLHILKLTVPLGADPVASMQRLEQRIIDADVNDLETIADDLRGSVQDLGAADLALLAARDPGVAATVSCNPGDLTPPRRTTEGLIVYGVVERRDPVDQPFDRVRQTVTETLLREHGHELQDEFSALVLDQHGFELFEDRILDPNLFTTLT